MADNEGLAGDSLERGGSFSQLLFSSNDDVLGFDTDGCFNYASSVSTVNPQKMLCFGDYQINNDSELSGFAQKSGITCSDSSSASSTNNTINNINPLLSKSKKKRHGRVNEPVAGPGAPVGNQGNGKKTKSGKTTAAGHAKGKKESIGERIAALQQLVSPFGKTDTASVLHEAMGYIRFLQDQVQVLCSPYLQPLHHEGVDGGENGTADESGKDLRSKGLCLVPVESTLHVANSNNADFWLPAMKTTNIASSDR